MSKKANSVVAVSGKAVSPPAFSSFAKPHKGLQSDEKTEALQGFAGVLSGETVPVMSKPQSDGFAAKQMTDDPAWIALQSDLDTLPTMALRAKYAGEANTHRNMLQRVKTCGAVVHPSFRSFADFLRSVGPKPTTRATLDRIDNNDPEYAPGKVRWADKATQNSNKGDSLIFTCLTTGRSYSAAQLAARQGVSATAIRKRRKQGWTDVEIIAGKRSSGLAAKATKIRQHPKAASRSGSAAEMLFRERREYCEQHRAQHGFEYFILTPAEFQAEVAEDFPAFRGEAWLRKAEGCFLRSKLPNWWKQYRPHINFAALRPDQQEWVLRIDPTQGQKAELADQL
ncbi:hypothetical protein [Roseibaca sp. Y0-43]|uniref:hypothetical protein n=1 Tax=Roseibaca sp. Y0-43 TaxID=2816854 RepID=UPI001D0C3DD9|nr:hypothetical protein [Roseibaca sp. Y0-43]MCC1480013.1 hypothetical protein [Roseibaca sp. Y0-43]